MYHFLLSGFLGIFFLLSPGLDGGWASSYKQSFFLTANIWENSIILSQLTDPEKDFIQHCCLGLLDFASSLLTHTGFSTSLFKKTENKLFIVLSICCSSAGLTKKGIVCLFSVSFGFLSYCPVQSSLSPSSFTMCVLVSVKSFVVTCRMDSSGVARLWTVFIKRCLK